MTRLLVLGLLIASAGCARESTPMPADQHSPEETAATADAPVHSSVPQQESPFTYPEQAEVQRLLVRASELEADGKFEDALAVANQAVAVDPSSPRANETKARLEELLRRIQPSPMGDDHSGSSSIAQRTTP